MNRTITMHGLGATSSGVARLTGTVSTRCRCASFASSTTTEPSCPAPETTPTRSHCLAIPPLSQRRNAREIVARKRRPVLLQILPALVNYPPPAATPPLAVTSGPADRRVPTGRSRK